MEEVMLVLALLLGASDRDGKQAAVSLAPRMVYYDIHGSTLDELAQQISRHGPIDPSTSQRHAGFTTWRVEWSYKAIEEKRRCRVASMKVRVKTEIVLPRWTPPAEAPQVLRDTWSAFVSKLEEHEREHARLATVFADGFKASALSMAARPNCVELGDALQADFDGKLEASNASQKAFDERTDHGRTAGVVLE